MSITSAPGALTLVCGQTGIFEAFFCGQELYSTSQIGTTARSMTRAFAFLPPFLLLPRFAERLGADRVVLGRELSIKEIASVAADVDDLEVEAQCLITHSFWLWAEVHWNLPSTLNWFEGVLADLAVWKRENLLLTKSWWWYVVISGSFLVPSSSPWMFDESWSWLMLTTVGAFEPWRL